MKTFDDVFAALESSFIWWYFDHYNLTTDPYGYFGYKANRAMFTHMKLKGSKIEDEFLDFLMNIKEYQRDYDCLYFDFEKINQHLYK